MRVCVSVWGGELVVISYDLIRIVSGGYCSKRVRELWVGGG